MALSSAVPLSLPPPDPRRPRRCPFQEVSPSWKPGCLSCWPAGRPSCPSRLGSLAPATIVPAVVSQTPSASRKSLDAPSWPGVYRLSMSLMERLLKTLRYNFLTEALDFVGVHQERTLQVRGCPRLGGRGCSGLRLGSRDAVRSAGCPRPTCQVRGMGWDQLSWNLLVRNLSHNAMPPGATTSASEGRSRCGWSLCHLVSPCVPLSQCLNAVRTVQSLACLEEADHTVGFILQLSSFMKEWHFHLPQLMRDVQVGLRRHPSAGLGTHSGAGR